jgi:hypothetical protein
MSSAMSSSMPSVIDIPTVLDHAGPKHVDPNTIDPAMLSRMGSMTYNWNENSYNLEWKFRADFNKWLTHEQAIRGIKIQLSKTQASKTHQLYSTCETFCCAHNGTGRKKHYVKTMTHERKIDSKQIEGGCPCFIQIKMYSHTNTILGRYDPNHSHSTGKDNLKYIWICMDPQELIEAWMHYGVTDQEIVSDPLLNLD